MAKNKVKCKTYAKTVQASYTHMPHTKVKRVRHKNKIQEPFLLLKKLKIYYII